MAGVVVFMFSTIAVVTFNIISGMEFLDRPQNVTLDSSWEQFTLKCRVNVSSPNGMDWTGELNGQENMRLCESVNSEVYKCMPNYSVERPDNKTMNLIVKKVDFQNLSVAGKYCCFPDDGQGTISACAYVTETDASPLPHTDITESNQATGTASTPTSSTTPGNESGLIAGISCGVLAVAVVVGLLICILYRRCPIYKCIQRQRNNRSGHNPNDPAVVQLTQPPSNMI